jgi:hypothetical protein
MKLKVGSYVRFRREGYDPSPSFGFIIEAEQKENFPYTILWNSPAGIITRGDDFCLILIYPPTKLTRLLFE